jgi:dihydroorotate dehydrogenase (NAD+) catalytic subunit
VSDQLLLAAGKRELRLAHPILNVAGTLGFSNEGGGLVDRSALGAFVTHPLSARPRSPANDVVALPSPGSFLLHTGLPNPGLEATIRQERRRWRELPCPLIVHVFDPSPTVVEDMLLRLEREPAVAAVEIGVERADRAALSDFASMAAASELPAILRLPLDAPLESYLLAAQSGAPILSMGPPRAAAERPDGTLTSGRLFGPALFPLALHKTSVLAAELAIPIIAAGGVTERPRTNALLRAGASAVALDTILWTDPSRCL